MPVLSGQFGRYQIVKKLGEGGMGAVYLADDTVMRRKVALKIPSFDGKENQNIIDRFHREARVAADIRHPGVCTVYDVGCQDGIHYLTMAYIEGTPLADLVQNGRPWPIAHAVALTMHIADALHALHARGIVHRDLKPGNIMLEPTGRPVLLDFGLARSVEHASQMLTADGNSLGTPAYMAPEQVSGKADLIGAWTDVYPLGVILFQLLTGRLPFQPATMAELYALLLHGTRPLPSQFVRGIPPDLDLLCQSAIAVDPRQRPANMPVFMERLQRCQAPTVAAVPSAPPVAVNPAPVGRTMPNDGYSITCPSCRKVVHISATMTGKRAMCPGCRKVIPETDPFAPVVMLEDVPEMTEPIQRRQPTRTDTIPSRDDRTQRRPTTTRLKHREPPIRKGGGMGWILGALLLILLPVGFGLFVWYLTADRNAGTSSSMVSPVAEQPRPFSNSLSMQFVWIPPGTYTMGTPDIELDRGFSEGPQHEVEISQGFYFAIYEVTQEDFKKVMGTTPSTFSETGLSAAAVKGLDTQRFPVEGCTWYSAKEFCQILSERPEEKQAKRRYRLPTEAEWEYAARGRGPYQIYSTGTTLGTTQANYGYEFGYKRTVPVDDPSFPANGFGLYHMHGNVYEWCSDWYDENYYSNCVNNGIRRNPPGPDTGNHRVLRGGSWATPASACRSGWRMAENPDLGFTDVGFRVICEIGK